MYNLWPINSRKQKKEAYFANIKNAKRWSKVESGTTATHLTEQLELNQAKSVCSFFLASEESLESQLKWYARPTEV